MEKLTPGQIVEELNKYVIGQASAKKSVAIALRNRYRRQQVSTPIREEIIPNNILMIGPTGVGKTEIARRLAKLVKAPFIKVEASKFTEVGYVGRDVESMIRDLVEVSVSIVKKEKTEAVRKIALALAEDKLLSKLLPKVEVEGDENSKKTNQESREKLLAKLRSGALNDRVVEIEASSNLGNSMQIFGPFGQMEEVSGMFQSLMEGMPKNKKKKRMKVKKALEVLTQEEINKLVDSDAITQDGISRAKNSGIVFIDEIDKIAGKGNHAGGDVSRQGVQQDLLPIVEGTSVNTKYGVINTDHILFIASGAFHTAKPSDLIAELQGRFPIRVELQSLSENDFVRILVEPRNAITKQYVELLKTDGVELVFKESSIKELASIATDINDRMENIGARRLYTIMTALLEDILFDAPDNLSEKKIVIDDKFVNEKLSGTIKDQNLSSYIL